MSKKTLLHLLFGFTLSASLMAQTTYTVDELLLQSLQNAPDLKASALRYEASQKRYDIAFSNYLPRVDFKASVAKAGMSDLASGGDKLIDDTIILGNLSLKQLVYDFGKTAANRDSSHYAMQSDFYKNMQKISDKKREVKLAYYSVLQAKALIAVQKENRKLNEAQLNRSQKYFTAGIRTKIDISDAKVALIKSKIDLKNAQYNLKLAYAKLERVIGFRSVNEDYDVYTPSIEFSTLFQTLPAYSMSLEQSVAYAYANKPQLLQYKVDTKSAVSRINIHASEYYPQFYFGADYTKQSLKRFQSLLPKEQWQVALNLDWNLYQGGASSAKTQESRLKAAQANYQLQDVKLAIKNSITNAYINLYRKKDTLELSQSLMEASALKFEQASKRYINGLSDYIELQEARQGYINAKAALVIDYYDYYIAIANLDNAIGK